MPENSSLSEINPAVLVEELTKPPTSLELQRKDISHNLDRYNRNDILFESPLADNALKITRERVDRRYSSVNLIDLQQIVAAELHDLKNQETKFTQSHPEWPQQKLATETAAMHVKQHKNQIKETHVFVSIAPDANKKFTCKIGKVDNMPYYKFPAGLAFLNNQVQHNDQFDIQKAQISELAELLGDKMVDRKPITLNEKEKLLDYLKKRENKWRYRKEGIAKKNTDEEYIMNDDNEAIFKSFAEKVRSYPVEEHIEFIEGIKKTNYDPSAAERQANTVLTNLVNTSHHQPDRNIPPLAQSNNSEKKRYFKGVKRKRNIRWQKPPDSPPFGNTM